MNFIWGLLTGIAVSTIAYLVWQKMKKPADAEAMAGRPALASPEKESANFNPKVETKKENVANLENFVAQKPAGEKITNDDVQSLLNVSDATAERYLQELEQKGLVKQEGETGHSVFYLKI